jgi:hypothetical protein
LKLEKNALATKKKSNILLTESIIHAWRNGFEVGWDKE